MRSTLQHNASPPVSAARLPLVTRSATLTIDHRAIAANLAILREVSGVDVMGVVKADAFGLGAVAVARTLAANGASSLGVATIDEAIALRRGGITLPILAWLAHPAADLTAALRLRIELSCPNEWMLLAVATAARALGVTARVHLEIDTGMNRGGASSQQWPMLCARAAELEAAGRIQVVGVWSHLAQAGNPRRSAVEDQVLRLTAAIADARIAGLNPAQHHLASSGAALAHPETRFTLARCGAALYGIEPVDRLSFGLHPVVRVSARVLHLRRVVAGSTVGYGAGHLVQRTTTLALIPIGYADGVPRRLADTGWLTVASRRCPIVGAVSMDQILIDVGNAPVEVGDEAVFIGDPTLGEPSLASVAACAGTIPQEILTALGTRFDTVRVGAERVA